MLPSGLVAATLAAVMHGAPAPDAPWAHAGPLGRVALHSGWVVARDPGDTGLARGWQDGRFAGTPVSVPYVPNALQITGAAGRASFQGSVAWYRRRFAVPSTGVYALDFGSVNHRATVWVDGRMVAQHVGEYLPFEVRLRLDGPRAHTLVVRADWRNPLAMKLSGWHRTWFNFGGINREVTLRRVGTTEVLSPRVWTTLRGGAAIVDVAATVRNDTGTPTRIPVTGSLTRGGQAVSFGLGAPMVPADGSAQVHARVRVERPALWSPESPSLYDLSLAADGAGTGYVARVGLRQLSWAGGRLRVNGRPVTLRGASIQEDALGRGDALRPSDQDALVRSLVALGADATRVQHPLDEGLMERLDAAGVLVWMGVGPVNAPGAWTSHTAAQLAEARDRVRTSVDQLQTHPSLIAWNLANEMAANGHDAGERSYLEDMTAELHATDPGRMVAVDIWGPHAPHHAGLVYRGIDAIGVTNYAGWYDHLHAPAPVVERSIVARLSALRRTFPGKLLAVSEFGAEGNSLNPTAEPGGFAFQARVVRMDLGVYRSLPWLGGALVWDLRDFAVAPTFAGGSIRHQAPGIRLVKGVNQKGLETYAGHPKPAYDAVRSLLRQMTAVAHARGAL